MKQAGGAQELEHRLASITREHRRMDERLQELTRRPHLTPTEQVELVELKKHKLRAKDALLALRRDR